MRVIVLGVSHHGAPLEVRERLTFASRELGDTLVALLERSRAREAVLLSTCNRTELYLAGDEDDAVAAGWGLLSDRLGSDASAYGYVGRDRDAVSHLFRVAAGMDSMVLGEAQIHGQVRAAWEASRPAAGVVLNRLFQGALSAGGRVRSETRLGHGALSVSSAAVQLAKKIFGELAGRRAMVLGAGDVAELALASLQEEGVRAAVVANRTFDRAQVLAERYGATAVHYDEAWAALKDVDLVLCSTASPRPVVEVERVRACIPERGDRPLCILDIALPRDVDPAVATLDNVYLYDLDDLRGVVSANAERRQRELPAAESIVANEVESFWRWLSGLSAVPVVTQLREAMNRVRERELQQAMRRLGDLTPEQRAVVEHLARSITNKFLHDPSVRLRDAGTSHRGLEMLDAARYLFALEDRVTDDGPAAPLQELPTTTDSNT